MQIIRLLRLNSCKFFIAIFLFSGSLHAGYKVKQASLSGRIGTALGEGLSESISREMEMSRQLQFERQLREQLQKEHRIATEMSYYNDVLFQLSYESAHPNIALSPEFMEPIIDKSCLEMNDNRTMGYLFKSKFNRVISDGTLVEWIWALDISNDTPSRFLSFGSMKYPKARFKIELLDMNNFVVSSCVYYADVFLERGKSLSMQGKWIIPYDQIEHVHGYQLSIGYP